MSKVAIIYGSSSGTAESVAKRIQKKIPGAELINAYKADLEKLAGYDFYILGTSTDGFGELQGDWDSLLPKFEQLDFTGKKGAIFALGDSDSYSTSFAGSMSVLYNGLKDKLELVGFVSADDYSYDDTESVIDGQFVGLALDEENESDKTDERIDTWLADLKKFL